MPWIVGIDEAGYGPNLGPFVMTAVACRVPQTHAAADLWEVFRSATRRHTDPPGIRIIVADSKVVFSQSRGLGGLEQTVHAAVLGRAGLTLSGFVELVCPECREDVRREIWYDGTTVLPVEADPGACSRAYQVLTTLCKSLDIGWGPIRSVIVCPTAFNALLDRWGSKGAVLTSSLVRLLRGLPRDDEQVSVFVDKHGGRNSYAAQLQPAFEGGLVIAAAEGSQRSTYQVVDGRRRVQVTFQPRAEASHFCVALASMVSKYLRELLMLEFNRFWQARVPRLKPTAGYPVDAKRFWADIRLATRKLKIEDDALWRRK